MLACVDTQYAEETSQTGVILFPSWKEEMIHQELVSIRQQPPEEYVPGEFYKRELPCILEAIQPVLDEIELIIVDGFVQLSTGKPGLGLKLYEALENIPVVGVAKNPFRGAENAIQIFRGGSSRPLFITAAGVDLNDAAKLIEEMHGEFRIPTLLKRVDQLAREQADL